ARRSGRPLSPPAITPEYGTCQRGRTPPSDTFRRGVVIVESGQSSSSLSLPTRPNTAMHPFSQSGTGPPFGTAKALNALLAARGTNTRLFAALAATECAVPAGCPTPAGPLYVGTD